MIDMTRGGIAKPLLLFTIPMFIGSVFQQFYNVADSVIVGKFLGKEALAAVGVTFPVMFLLVALITGATMGITVLISQYFGAGDDGSIKKCIETAFIFLAVMALAVTFSGLLFTDRILALLGTPSVIFTEARGYIRVIFTGLFFLFGYNSISAILRGLGDSQTPLYLLVFSTLLNVCLDLLFVIVFKWGVRGAAVATVMAQGFSFAGGIFYLQAKNRFFRINYSRLGFDREIFSGSLKIGLPTGIQQMLVAAGMMALTRLVNSFGTDTLAAFTAAGRIDSFAMMPAMNLSMAMSTFVGQNIGAGRHDRVKAAIKTGLAMSAVIALTITASVIIFSHPLLSLFTDDPAVISTGSSYLGIVGSFYIAFMTMFIFNGALRGAGDTLIPMFITLLSLWLIRIPVSVFLSGRMGTDGIWWGIPVAWVAGALLAGLYFSTGRWKEKKLIKKP